MVVLSVEDDHGQQMLMQDLIHNVKSQHDECKFAAVQLLDALIEVKYFSLLKIIYDKKTKNYYNKWL